MDLPAPFFLAASIPGRKHGPSGYVNYQNYKDWLRDEFSFRCVYCLERETWYPNREAAFAVEHILPKTARPDLICEYDNLGYACLRCNSFKQDIIAIDPSREALAQHIFFLEDGSVRARTAEGQRFIDLLHLNVAPAVEVRKEKLWVLRLKRLYPDDPSVAQLFLTTFGYPADLPNLAMKRPKTNSRPAGVRECFFFRRRSGTLPPVY